MLLVYPPIQDGMNHEVELTDDIVCFTDGSQQAQTGTSGAGVYIQLQVKAPVSYTHLTLPTIYSV